MTTASHPRWREAAAFAGLIFVWLLATSWARPLAMPDEGRYVEIAWEMIRSGDWLTPTLDGLPFFHKPPLFYWITAASMSMFGLNEWAARAAPILGAWTGAFGLFLFARRWSGDRAARLTLLALLVHPLFFVGGQFANLDMLVAGFISASILLFAHSALSVEQGLPNRTALAFAYAMAALGVLSKGLIGAVIPALVILCWLATTQRWRALRSLVWIPGIAVFVLIAAPWFVAMQAHSADFLNYFFVVQQFQRFAGTGFNNVQPVWFYPAILIVGSLPWLPWLYRSFKRHDLTAPGQSDLRLLMWIWVAMIVLFFSLPKSKLLGYVLPALPPLAFLIADGFSSLTFPSIVARRVWRVSTALGIVLGVGAVLTFSVHPLHSSKQLAAALESRHGTGEPIFMLNHFYYDIPFYARLGLPVRVVDDWSNPNLRNLDNWRKELADAGQFAPMRSAATLITPAALPASICDSAVSWVIGATTAGATYRFLDHANAVFSSGGTTLWRVASGSLALANDLRCAGLAPRDTSRLAVQPTDELRAATDGRVAPK